MRATKNGLPTGKPFFHEDRSSQRERDEDAVVVGVDATEGDGLQGGDHVVEDEGRGPDDPHGGGLFWRSQPGSGNPHQSRTARSGRAGRR